MTILLRFKDVLIPIRDTFQKTFVIGFFTIVPLMPINIVFIFKQPFIF
jgi:hypothetical protein